MLEPACLDALGAVAVAEDLAAVAASLLVLDEGPTHQRRGKARQCESTPPCFERMIYAHRLGVLLVFRLASPSSDKQSWWQDY